MDQMHLASNIFLGTFGVELLNRPEHYPHPVLRSVKLFDDFRHSLKSCCKSWVWMEGKEKKLDEKELSVKKVKTTKFRADLLERRKVPLFSFYNSEKMSQISQKAFRSVLESWNARHYQQKILENVSHFFKRFFSNFLNENFFPIGLKTMFIRQFSWWVWEEEEGKRTAAKVAKET